MLDFNNKYVQMGVKAGAVAIGLLALFLLSKTITEVVSWGKNDEVYPARTITVNAVGEALAVSDIASFSFSVNEEGATSKEAQDKATEKMNKALDYFKQNGVEDKDIKTEYYNIYPKYESVRPCTAFDCPAPTQKIIGYTVDQSVRVKVRDTDNAGKFLGDLAGFGISNVSGLDFTTDDKDALYDLARKDAVEKVEKKAKELAKSLDVRLGKVISFNENNISQDGYGGAMMEMSAKAVANPSVPMGENKYMTEVYITYELK